MTKKISIIIVCIVMILTNTYVFADDSASPTIRADSGILMDAVTGQILCQKNMNKIEYPASITKIMTTLLGIENGNLDDMITMSRNAVFSVPRDAAHIALDTDEQISLGDALMAAMLPSANEACNGIAEHISGSVESFANLMNERAVLAGAVNTHFVNPNGLHDAEHVTTAYDMAMITREALKNDEFRRILGTTAYQIAPTNKQSEIRYLWNTHKMLKESEFYYEKAIGGKTGYTSEAHNTLVTVAKDGDRELIVVLLNNTSGGNNYRDTAKLFDYGFNNFSAVQLTEGNLNISTDADADVPDDFTVSKVEATEVLLHNSLEMDDIIVNFEESQDDSDIKKLNLSVKLKETSEFMYSSLGQFEYEVPVKNLSDSGITGTISRLLYFAIRIAGILIFALVIIYYYVNRNYYRKRILRKLKKKRKKSNNDIKRKKVS